MEEILSYFANYFKQFPLEKAVFFICLSAICLIALKLILFIFDKLMKRSNVNPLISKVIRIVTKIFLVFIMVIILLGSTGVSVTSLIATLSVVGIAFSLAIQGFLSNVFGGMQIISNKPFKIGDYIEVGKDAGLVREVGLFYTKLDTYDKKLIQIPNSKMANENIINYTNASKRRVEFVVCVSYENEVEKVISVLVEAMAAHPLVLKEEDFMPYAHVKEYQYSHICYTARAWCATADYWTVYFDIMDSIQPTFAKNGVAFSYPHMNVHMMTK